MRLVSGARTLYALYVLGELLFKLCFASIFPSLLRNLWSGIYIRWVERWNFSRKQHKKFRS